MKNFRNFRAVGAIAIIIMAASVVSMANISESETEINPELPVALNSASWTILGSKGVGLNKGQKTIRLRRGFGSMAKIQIRLRFNQVEVNHAILHFKNGDTQEVELKPNVLGEKIYLINVKDGGQKVRKVTVSYDVTEQKGVERFYDYDEIEIWGVPTDYLRSGYNDRSYPTVRYDTFGDVIRREQYSQNGNLVYCPR